jgi:hypothetical protein
MSDQSYIDIKESYVDEKLKEFFGAEKNDVNIDNICLFAAKTVEEYNEAAEKKIKGKQKLDAAVDLAKTIIEKSVAFVEEDQRRQIVKNIYYNLESIPQTIQFIVSLTNNPNIVNAHKWVLSKSRKVVEVVDKKTGGLFSRLCCNKPKPEAPVAEEAGQESKPEEEPKAEVKKLTKEELKKQKEDEIKRQKEEKLQRELENLRMTPEERAAKVKEAKDKAEAEKKAAKEKIENDKKAAKEQKRLDEIKRKEKKLQEALDKLKKEEEAPKPEEPVKVEEVKVEEKPAEEPKSE